MVSTVPKDAATAQEHSSPEVFRNAFRWMLLARALDEKLASLYRAGKIPGGGVYLGRGQEALSVSIGLSLLPGDVFAPLIRDGAGRLAFGEQVIDAVGPASVLRWARCELVTATCIVASQRKVTFP